jgi:hypothetical protein
MTWLIIAVAIIIGVRAILRRDLQRECPHRHWQSTGHATRRCARCGLEESGL